MSSEKPKASTSNADKTDIPIHPSDWNQSFENVVQTVKTLRGPNGCPWDKEQTHESLVPYAIEETFELAQAIESKDDAHFKDELGDVLFQVLLHANMAEERKAFTLKDVMENLNQKLIRRHPHVFSNEVMEDMTTIFRRWDEIKADEKKNEPKHLIEVAPMPALQRAVKIGKKTNKLKFDWTKASEVREKLIEELAEVDEALLENDQNHLEEEFGDLLFTAAQWARHLGLDPETVLRKANEKFLSRFNQMDQLVRKEHRQFTELSADEKETLWRNVKNSEK